MTTTRKKKICIDAGHGSLRAQGHIGDPGAVNRAYYESVAALSIAKKVGVMLKEKGYDARLTRSTENFVTLANRAKISNEFEADAFISIHLNASDIRSASGIETWRYEHVGRTTKALSKNVQTELIAASGAKDRGVKTTTTMYVLKHTVAPAILIEVGFISNNDECKKLFTDAYQEKIATAIVKGIVRTM